MGELRRKRDRQWIAQGGKVCGPVAFCVDTGRGGRAMPGKRHASSYGRRGSSLRGERKEPEREMTVGSKEEGGGRRRGLRLIEIGKKKILKNLH